VLGRQHARPHDAHLVDGCPEHEIERLVPALVIVAGADAGAELGCEIGQRSVLAEKGGEPLALGAV